MKPSRWNFILPAFLLGSAVATADESRFNAPPPLVNPSPSAKPNPTVAPAPAIPEISPDTAKAQPADNGVRTPAQEIQESAPTPMAEDSISAPATTAMAATHPSTATPTVRPSSTPLFDDANFFGGNQAKDLRTRTAEEQVEILTRYVQIQSEQIRALREELQQALAQKSNSSLTTASAAIGERTPANSKPETPNSSKPDGGSSKSQR